MRKSVSRSMFEAMGIMTAQQVALSNPNPPLVIVTPPTAAGLRERRERDLVKARADAYQAEQAKAAAESKRAQELGATQELLRALGATPDEQRALARCPVSEVPTALADLRRPAPPNVEVFEQMYSVLK